MIFADLHEGKRPWKSETRTNSLTSGPRSPTKIENSGPRSSLRQTLEETVQTQYTKSTKINNTLENLPTIDKSATRSPVELEGTARVGNLGTVEGKSLLRSLRGAELDEAIARITVTVS